jgi:RAT1-interacting protein
MADRPPPNSQRVNTNTSSRATFPIEPLSQYAGACAVIKQPMELTYFSYDKERQLHHDASSMVPVPMNSLTWKYYYPPRIPEDLESGFDEFIKFDEIDEHLDSLLASLQRYEETQEKPVQVDFITWRGMMTKIMTVVLNWRD